ncbi:hypothetical protein GCM10010954_31710 [Halobacillus andaensis]|uniref:Levanase n=1 Tax=Halobacillus andaensis TaxID=1176239 RepID=A0A917BBG7_HALAA|nr:glycoside hydrolase family 32 protein [Halobacillus andaensis]MBP2005277.1 fructan beta-fructosidase [Halobacillus andaensis]GGF30245.1 hypothetical protein GCM10010954_31710 [Halobacillus andaensis]
MEKNKELVKTEKYRPHLHFTPQEMWMNDPNGLVYFEGEYHLFYQYHPQNKKWGPMHWGHAVSKDLLKWQHLPIALYPDELGYIFSGSVVVDWEDTSGFFDGGHGLIAMFTHAKEELQRQSIAYSKDQGRTWKKYEGNPVIENPNIQDFRDPKVIWHEASRQWAMVLAAGKKVIFYTSPDLKSWSLASEFGEGWGAQEGTWECPDIFPLQHQTTGEQKWVLQIGIDAGGPAGGSGTQYFIGDFDGKTFSPEQRKHEIYWLDLGKDFYAAQSFSDVPDEQRIVLAWMSNWQYANEVPTHPWRSAMSIPRELSLQTIDGEDRVIQTPVKTLEENKESFHSLSSFEVEQGEEVEIRQPRAPFRVIVEVEYEAGFEVQLFAGEDGKKFSIGLNGKEVYFERDFGEETSFSSDFTGRFHQQLLSSTKKAKLSILCDESSVEVFLNEGETALTNLYLPVQKTEQQINVRSTDGKTLVHSIHIDRFDINR